MQMQEPLEESFAARKAESLKGWETATLDGMSLLGALRSRTSVLFRNPPSVSVRVDGPNAVVHRSSGATFVEAAAAPVSDDGYFLTAAHVVKGASSLILIGLFKGEDGTNSVRKVPVRVVWQPETIWMPAMELEFDDPSLGPDIAIIHADGVMPSPFTISNEPQQVDDPVVIAGCPIGNFGSFPERNGLAAGQIQSVGRRDAVGSNPAYTAVLHNAPSVVEDSGGPVLDRNGYLIGINSTGRNSLLNWHALTAGLGGAPRPSELDYSNRAIMPDPIWLRELIEQDRAASNSRPKNDPEQP